MDVVFHGLPWAIDEIVLMQTFLDDNMLFDIERHTKTLEKELAQPLYF